MQFSIATLAVLATAVIADSTKYITEEVTITSCHPTVTNCPARSTVVSMTTYPVVATTTSAPVVPVGPSTATRYTTIVNTITSCHPTITNCPYGSLTSTVIPVHPGTNATATVSPPKPTAETSKPVVVVPSVPASSAPAPSAPAPSAPAAGPVTVTVTVTQCPAVPTAPAASVPVVPGTSVPVVPSKPVVTVPAASGTGVPVKPSNGTSTSPAIPKFTGAASTMTGSVGAIAFAGLVAVFFA